MRCGDCCAESASCLCHSYEELALKHVPSCPVIALIPFSMKVYWGLITTVLPEYFEKMGWSMPTTAAICDVIDPHSHSQQMSLVLKFVLVLSPLTWGSRSCCCGRWSVSWISTIWTNSMNFQSLYMWVDYHIVVKFRGRQLSRNSE